MAEFSAAEWKVLIKKHLTPIIEQKLQLKQIADTVWASDYHNGSRKVLSLFYINDAYATLKWGRNFEFVPKCPGTKVMWARTDKSIFSHIFEVPEKELTIKDFNYMEQRKLREKVIISRTYNEKDPKHAWLQTAIHHKNAFYYSLPAIKAFYQETETLEDCLEKIESQLNHGYYNFINGSHLFLSKIFIEYYLGQKDKALADFNDMYVDDESLALRDQFYKKLMMLDKE